VAIAQTAKVPQLEEWIYWYAATLEGESLNRVVSTLPKLEGAALHRRLTGLWLAMEPRANVPMPAAWKQVAARLYESKEPEVQRLADQLASAFGDATAFPRMRTTLSDSKASRAARQHAFAVLSRAQDREALPAFLGLLDDGAFRTAAINLLARFESAETAPALVKRFKGFAANDRAAALNSLTSRPSFALTLLDAVASGEIERSQVTAYYVRQLSNLKSSEIDKRVISMWGRINQTPAEKQAQIARAEKVFSEAPLWAYSGNAGRKHFETLCAPCHRIGNEGTMLGPELTGAGKHGVRYFLENVIDPDAVIGTDFQMTNLETKDGDSISGLIVNETASAVTVRTTAGETVVPKKDIQSRATSEKSLMPEGLLDSLGEREKIELLKFLTSN
jgi:putative heme-binding domain-containing protein